jgi:hypothetical protein
MNKLGIFYRNSTFLSYGGKDALSVKSTDLASNTCLNAAEAPQREYLKSEATFKALYTHDGTIHCGSGSLPFNAMEFGDLDRENADQWSTCSPLKPIREAHHYSLIF